MQIGLVGLGRMDHLQTGHVLTASGKTPAGIKWPEPLPPLYALAVDPENRNDEVKLTAAFACRYHAAGSGNGQKRSTFFKQQEHLFAIDTHGPTARAPRR